MIIVENPTLESIPLEERESGISLILRVRNGEDFLRLVIDSAINQVDEIVIVFNESIDRTEEILLEAEKVYSDKIKLYKYIPFVYPPNDNYYHSGRVKSDDPHALSHYYNFALSKTRFSHVCKHDDDNLVFPNTFRSLKAEVEQQNNNVMIGLRGINLFDLDQKLFVNKKESYTHGGDTVMFKYAPHTHYVQAAPFEVFFSDYRIVRISICFFHLKYCKNDRGMNNYNLNRNQRSRFVSIYNDFFANAELVPLDKFLSGVKYPDPFELGFKFLNESKKSYDYQIFSNFEEKLKEKYLDKSNQIDTCVKS